MTDSDSTVDEVRPVASGSLGRRHGRPRHGLGFAVPAIVVLGLAFVWPLVQILTLAFQSSGTARGGFTIENFEAVLTDGSYLTIAADTFALILGTAAVTLLIGYPVAYFISRSRSRWAHWAFVAVVAPLLVSAVVRTLGWLVLLGDRGPVKAGLATFGLSGGSSLLFNPIAVVLALVHLLLPFMVLSILASLAGVDRRIEESARVLGASPWNVLWRVTIPLTKPGIVAGLVLVASLALGAYLTPAFIGGGRTQVLATSIYTEALINLDGPRASALAVVVMVATVVVVVGGSILTGRSGSLRKAIA